MDTLLLNLLLSSYRRLRIQPDPNGHAMVSAAVEQVGRLEFISWVSVAHVHGIMYGSGVDAPAGLYTEAEANALASWMGAALTRLVRTHDWCDAPFVTDAEFQGAADLLDYLAEKNK